MKKPTKVIDIRDNQINFLKWIKPNCPRCHKVILGQCVTAKWFDSEKLLYQQSYFMVENQINIFLDARNIEIPYAWDFEKLKEILTKVEKSV